MAGPDGAPNYGWYVPNQIPGGALVAKIGDKGTIFKVGRQMTFTAKNSGDTALSNVTLRIRADQGAPCVAESGASNGTRMSLPVRTSPTDP